MTKKKWVFFVLCWSGMAIYFTERWIFGPMIPYLMVDFRIDRVQAGGIGSAQILGFLLMPLLAGFLSDRLGRKPVILSGLLGIALFTCLSGLTTSHHQMYATRFLSGMSEPLFSVPLIAYFMELFPNYPAFFVTLMISGTSVGWFAGPILSGWCIGTLGSWRYPFWISGLAGLVLFGVLLFYWYDQKSSKLQTLINTRATFRFGGTVGFTVLITLSLVVFFDNLAEFGFSMWLPSFLKEERSFSILQAGIIASMWGIGQFFGRPLLGLLGDRTGYRHVGIPSAFIMALSFYFIVNSQSYASFIFWQLAAGFIGGAVMGSLWTFSAIFFDRMKGTALGFVSNIGNLGSLAAPVLGGYLADRYTLADSLITIGVFSSVLSGLLFLSSFIWVRRNVRNRRQNIEAENSE